MKRKVIATILCATMVFNLVACGDKKKSESKESEVVESEVVESEVAESEVIESVVEEEPVEEEPESLMGFNMINNPNFDEGVGDWFPYTKDGKCILDCVDGELVVDITSNGTVEHGCQIYYDGFKVEQGCQYEIQFDAYSTTARDVEYRIQINGGDYHAYNQEYISLTPEVQHFDIIFTMEEASDPAPRLCFNMGLMENGNNADGDHRIAFDNFELYCIDESGRVGGAGSSSRPSIAVNQIGYRTGDNKVAVFNGDDIDTEFSVVDVATGESVFEGKLSAASVNENTKQNEAVADFSSVKTPGTYKIVGEKCGESFEFVIDDNVYDDAFASVVKMFYLQRCGSELKSDNAGDFAHAACHSEKAVYYEDQNGKAVDVSGGWHDAGDYGRYVVAGSKAVSDMLLAYENYKGIFTDNVGIPESGNGTPDILDEARYELEWLFKMQDADGGVHHKVTCAVFPETVMPEEETDKLIITPVSTTATGTYAAVMAQAARVYKDVDSAFADKCLKAAESAYDYLSKNTSIKGAQNPDGIVTGAYDDTDDTDERLWAAAELYKTTGDSKYEADVKTIFANGTSDGLGWQGVGYYAAYAYVTSDCSDSALKADMVSYIKDAAADLVGNAAKDSYQSSIYLEYPWGSNMTIANNGMLLLMSDEVAGTNYKSQAKAQLDYLFGNNGTGYCFLTGYGTQSPTGTHHRPSQALGKTMAGMLVGGPNCNLEDPYAQAVLADEAPALCYVDNSQSYSCNEITIYWNSPLVYLMAGILSK